jgi:hypothetical protein
VVACCLPLAACGASISACIQIGRIEMGATVSNACLSVIGGRSRELRGWLLGGRSERGTGRRFSAAFVKVGNYQTGRSSDEVHLDK